MQTLEPIVKPIFLSPLQSKLYEQAKELIKIADYKHVTPEDVIAVCEKESGCNPIFQHEDPLFIANMGAAYEGSKLPRQMIWEAILIKKGPYSGHMAKFRFEPAYWEWSGTQRCNSLQLRIQLSCSFGIGQQMMRWIIPHGKPDEWIAFIENFKADTGMQLKYLLSNLNKLLQKTGNDLDHAYRGYNSGDINSDNLAVLVRAENVVKARNKIREELNSMTSNKTLPQQA